MDRKVKLGHVMNHPDAPERDDAKLYYCHDVFGNENTTDLENSNTLSGNTSGFDAESAQNLAMKMMSAKMPGPKFNLAPNMDVAMVGKPGKSSGKPGGKPKPKKESSVPPAKKAGTGTGMVMAFKTLPKLVTEIKRVKDTIPLLTENPLAVSFVPMIESHLDTLKALYEEMRTLLAETPLREDSGGQWYDQYLNFFYYYYYYYDYYYYHPPTHLPTYLLTYLLLYYYDH